MSASDILPHRTVSNFPNISIGTGLALETLIKPDAGYYDPDRTIPEKKENYKTIWLNGYTLLRNIVSSISTTDEKHKFLMDSKNVEYLIITFLEELKAIEDLLKENKYVPILFIPNYKKNKNLHKLDRNILEAKDTDSLSGKTVILISKAIDYLKASKTYDNLLSDTKDYLLSNSMVGAEYLSLLLMELKTGYKIKPTTTGGDLVMTHFYIDMLNIKYFPKLSLLESHTGKIKKHYEINSKYPTLKNMDFKSVVPFSEKMYYIFGDSNLLKPYSAKLRRLLYELFLNNKINSTSTKASVDKIIESNAKEIYDVDNEFMKFYKNINPNY